MKKALQITLAGHLFTIEEDGYEKLNQYLTSIKAYFKNMGDSEDVVDDIEARIAEQLLERIQKHNNIVTIHDVTHVMDSMGTVEEISGMDTDTHAKAASEEATATSASRKLFRSSDDVVIAGVAAGLAAYVGIEAFAMRIIFVILLLVTSGGFALLYIALAFLIPEAKTATDKVKMRGGPVTLASFKEDFNEQMHMIKNNSEQLFARNSAFRNRLEQFFRVCGSVIQMAVKIIVKVIGLFLVVIPVFICLALIFIAGNLIFNYHSPYIDFPIAEVISQPLYLLFIMIGFIILFIPTLFVGSLGATIVRGKPKMSGTAAMILGGIWIMALILAGTLGVRTSLDVRDKVMTLPAYQTTTQTIEVVPFTKIDLRGRNNVTYVQGATYSITATGRKTDIQPEGFTVEEGTLTIQRKNNTSRCIVCFDPMPLDITITAPKLEEVRAENSTRFTSENIAGDSLTLHALHGAFINAAVNVQNLIVDVEDIGRLMATGTTTELTLRVKNGAQFDGENLQAANASVTAEHAAEAHVFATGKLEITAANASEVTYKGTKAIVHTENDADVIDVSTSTKRAVDLSRESMY